MEQLIKCFRWTSLMNISNLLLEQLVPLLKYWNSRPGIGVLLTIMQMIHNSKTVETV